MQKTLVSPEKGLPLSMRVALSARTISSPPKATLQQPSTPHPGQLASSVLFRNRRSQGFSSDEFGSWPTSTSTPQHSHTQGTRCKQAHTWTSAQRHTPLTDFHVCTEMQNTARSCSSTITPSTHACAHNCIDKMQGLAGTRETAWKGKDHAFSYLLPPPVKHYMSCKVQIKCRLPHEVLPDFPPEHQVLPHALPPGSLSFI